MFAAASRAPVRLSFTPHPATTPSNATGMTYARRSYDLTSPREATATLMSKRLYLLRHAKSSWKHPELTDHERPLAGRGRRAAKTIVRQLLASWSSTVTVTSSSCTRTGAGAVAAGRDD
jgi:hypothetical protein